MKTKMASNEIKTEGKVTWWPLGSLPLLSSSCRGDWHRMADVALSVKHHCSPASNLRLRSTGPGLSAMKINSKDIVYSPLIVFKVKTSVKVKGPIIKGQSLRLI